MPSRERPLALLLLGPVVAFFATGYFTGFGAVTAEIYPTEIRATAQGFTYNIGRIASAVAPWAVGRLAETRGFGAAFSLSAVAFVCAARHVDLDPRDQGPRPRLTTNRGQAPPRPDLSQARNPPQKRK